MFIQNHLQPPQWEGVHNPVGTVRGSGLVLSNAGQIISKGGASYCAGGYCAIHIVTRGRNIVRAYDGKRELIAEKELKRGDMFCVLPDGCIEYFSPPHQPWDFYWLMIEGASAGDLCRDNGFTSEHPWNRPDHPQAVMELFAGIITDLRAQPPVSPYWLLSRLYLLGDLCRSSQRENYELGLVQQAREIISTQLHQELCVSSIAKKLHVARTTLFIAFKRELGCSVIEYLRRERVARAKEMLALGQEKISVIARSCGFTNEKYFLRTFKAITGSTPGDFRKDKWIAP